MSAPNRYATLESDLLGNGAEAAPARTRRRTPEQLTGRAAAPSAAIEAPAPAPTPPAAGDVFYDKGAATAANFRPSYWTYEQNGSSEEARPPTAVAAQPTARVVEFAPPPPLPVVELARDAADPNLGDEPPAVVGMPLATPSHQPAAAAELAATIEHVLVSRYASNRKTQETPQKPHIALAAITADSLIAELAQARQSRSEQGEAASTPRPSSRPPKKATSVVDRIFAFGGLALVLFALLALSPWRDSFLSPSITHFFG